MPKQTARNWAAESSYKNISATQRQRKYLQGTVNAPLERLEWISNAYRGSYTQGTILLQAVRLNAARLVNEQMIVETAKHILRTWEPNSVDTPRSLDFVKFVRYLVIQTAFDISDVPLDNAIVMSCVSSSAIPVVCPMIALVIASGYIDRLSKKHPTTMVKSGSVQRLFLTAYTIAVKYIHSNLGAVVAASPLLLGGMKIMRYSPSASTTTSPQQFYAIGKDPIASPPTSPNLARHSSYSYAQSRTAPYLHRPSRILASTTSTLAALLPRTTPHELMVMELEFLQFLDCNIAVHSVDEIAGWWERCTGSEMLQVVPGCGIGGTIGSAIISRAEPEPGDADADADDDMEVPNL